MAPAPCAPSSSSSCPWLRSTSRGVSRLLSYPVVAIKIICKSSWRCFKEVCVRIKSVCIEYVCVCVVVRVCIECVCVCVHYTLLVRTSKDLKLKTLWFISSQLPSVASLLLFTPFPHTPLLSLPLPLRGTCLFPVMPYIAYISRRSHAILANALTFIESKSFVPRDAFCCAVSCCPPTPARLPHPLSRFSVSHFPVFAVALLPRLSVSAKIRASSIK